MNLCVVGARDVAPPAECQDLGCGSDFKGHWPHAPVSRHLLAQLAMAILATRSLPGPCLKHLLAEERHQSLVEQGRMGIRLTWPRIPCHGHAMASNHRSQHEEPEDGAGDAAPVPLDHHRADLQPWPAGAAIQLLRVILRSTACTRASVDSVDSVELCRQPKRTPSPQPDAPPVRFTSAKLPMASSRRRSTANSD